MRIIAGTYRGRKLFAPKGEGTRPTTDRVRESLMSSLASARGTFDGAVVLDAFAGSGALGLEALSRGAAVVRFCERDGAAFRTLERNIALFEVSSQVARAGRVDVLRDGAMRAPQPYDMVFLDPPYAYAASDVLGLVVKLAERRALAESALIVYEHDVADNAAVDEAVQNSGLSLASRKKYGDTVVDILRWAACEDEDGFVATNDER